MERKKNKILGYNKNVPNHNKQPKDNKIDTSNMNLELKTKNVLTRLITDFNSFSPPEDDNTRFAFTYEDSEIRLSSDESDELEKILDDNIRAEEINIMSDSEGLFIVIKMTKLKKNELPKFEII